jgi:S1-C subfamily serine protease
MAAKKKAASAKGLSVALQKRVIAATVKLTDKGGQGVLVPGGYVMTAAHCVPFDTDGSMTLDSMTLTGVQTVGGKKFRMNVLAVEAVMDIALLGPADDQELPSDAEAFEAFAEATAPVLVSSDDFDLGKQVQAFVWTHTKKWVGASVARHGGFPNEPPAGYAWMDAEASITPGTSGGPIVDLRGCLIGVVSSGSARERDSSEDNRLPRPHLTLPPWLWQRIIVAQKENA